MDVPTQATRRIERYGLLALVLFLTTFGVLYAWDSPSSSEESSDTVMAGGRAVSGVQPRSTARPSRLPSADSARESRQANLPRANVDHEQRQLAERQRARREAARVEAERAAARGLGSEDRNKMVGHFRDSETKRTEGYDSPARDVSVSGYSGSRVTEEAAAPKSTSAPERAKMEYLVESGDCLSTIAQNELGSVRHLSRLLEVNGITESATLRVGQRLILPHIGDRDPVRGADLEPKKVKATGSGTWTVVAVREGDSLWKIAARVLGDGNRYHEIMEWNEMSSETLQPGMELRMRTSVDGAIAMGKVSR